MSNISIKNVPEPIAAALHARANRNHRSLQGELMAILEAAANDENLPLVLSGKGVQPQRSKSLERIAGYSKLGQPIIRQGSRGISDIARELKSRHPEPISAQSSSLEILRELRDSR